MHLGQHILDVLGVALTNDEIYLRSKRESKSLVAHKIVHLDGLDYSMLCDTLQTWISLQFRWAKVESATQGGTDTWNLFYQTDPAATGATAAWTNVGTDFKFGPNGQMQPVVGQL